VARLAVLTAISLGSMACGPSPSATLPASSAASSAGATAGPSSAPTRATEASPSLGTGPATSGRIAFVWRQPGTKTGGLAMIHADGSGRTLIADTGEATEPAISPDGARIAYTNGGSDSGIWTMKIDGTDRKRIARVAKDVVSGPTWSPDGTRLAFVALPIERGDAPVPSDIWLVDADGTHLTKLTSTASGDRPTWSPDGTRIAFATLVGGGISGIRTDGQSLAPITGGPDLSPAWAPDGHRIAFQRQDETDPNDVVAHIMVVFSDGSNLEQLTKGTTDDEGPCWSPDGRGLVFGQFVTTPNGNGVADLVILSGDGTATDLTNTPDVSEYLPSWR
jgi:Tol biopolymer transport system component